MLAGLESGGGETAAEARRPAASAVAARTPFGWSARLDVPGASLGAAAAIESDPGALLAALTWLAYRLPE